MLGIRIPPIAWGSCSSSAIRATLGAGHFLVRPHLATLALAVLRLFHIVPILIVAPFAGVFVDRWSRRWPRITDVHSECPTNPPELIS